MIAENLIEKYYQAAVVAVAWSPDSNVITGLSNENRIIVFNNNFHLINTKVLIEGFNKVVCIEVPLNDLENLLANERFKSSSVILKAIVNGQMTKNSDINLLRHIRSVARRRDSINSSVPITNLSRNLEKLLSEFRMDLNESEKLLQINEIVVAIISIECQKQFVLVNNARKKLKILKFKTPEFVNELDSIINSIHKNIDDPKTLLSNFIERHELTVEKKEDEPKFKWLVLDVTFDNISVESSMSMIVHQIKKDIFLEDRYQFCYLSPTYRQIYPNVLSLVFLNSDFVTGKIYNHTETLIIENQTGGKLSMNPTLHLLSTPFDLSFSHFCEVNIQVSRLFEKIALKESIYDTEKGIILCVVLCSAIIHHLNIGAKDVINTCLYMSSRWILSPIENEEIQFQEQYVNAINNSLKISNHYYQNNKTYINNAAKKGKELLTENEDNIYSPVIASIKRSLNDQDKLDKIIQAQSLTIQIIRTQYGIVNSHQAVLLIMLFEQIAGLLFLSNKQKNLCLFSLSQTITYIEIY